MERSGERAGGAAEAAWRAARAGFLTGLRRGGALLQRSFDGGYRPGERAAAAPGISIADLTVAYQRRPAIEQVSIEFPACSMTAIVGPNGAGKSTLLKAIAGILPARGGRIGYDGGSPRDIAYLPQSDEVERGFPITVGEFVALGRWRQYGAFAPAGAGVRDGVRRALEAVGLAAAQDRPIAALSVGQFRRALFARLVLQDAGALLLDEPFAAIDAATTAELLQLVERWHGEGRTIIAVLHDIGQVRAHFPRAVLLARRCIATGDTAAVLSEQNLARAGLGGAAGEGA